ncbi:MAG: SIS domain-containing protein [Planctomycetota bacterium]|nr:SIS domain-containing protein [Planctomycetota bacterium]
MDTRALDLSLATRVVAEEGRALQTLAHSLEHAQRDAFLAALDVLERCAAAHGTILITGLGKSGLIGAKIAATLSSLGVASHFVHPTEAAHGDLGRFRAADVVIAISASGETDEVVNLVLTLRQDNIPVIAITAWARPDGDAEPQASGATNPPRTGPVGVGATESVARSSLARLSSVALSLCLTHEAGAPDFVAPTSSTTATLALGDALALCLARRRAFTEEDFARRHPGGSLGGLLRPVVEILRFRAGDNLPLVPHDASVSKALELAAAVARRPGAILIIDDELRLAGIFTDGDLRRLVLRDVRELERPIEQVMTRSPRTLPATALVRDAVRMVKEFRQDEIPIVDAHARPVGLLDVQDLIAMRLVSA